MATAKTTPRERAAAVGQVEKILTGLDPDARGFVIRFIHDSYPGEVPAQAERPPGGWQRDDGPPPFPPSPSS